MGQRRRAVFLVRCRRHLRAERGFGAGYGSARSGHVQLLLSERRERAAGVVPRSCAGHHAAERVRRSGFCLCHSRSGRSDSDCFRCDSIKRDSHSHSGQDVQERGGPMGAAGRSLVSQRVRPVGSGTVRRSSAIPFLRPGVLRRHDAGEWPRIPNGPCGTTQVPASRAERVQRAVLHLASVLCAGHVISRQHGGEPASAGSPVRADRGRGRLPPGSGSARRQQRRHAAARSRRTRGSHRRFLGRTSGLNSDPL